MDINQLRHILSSWAPTLPYRVRIHFYGSRFTGTNDQESDYDLAIEFLEPVHRTLVWMDNQDQWQNALSEITNSKIHLELFDAQNVHVKKYVNEQSVVVFESPEESETDDEDFLKDLASLKNIE